MKSQDKKIRILFVLPSLSRGGAERVISFLAQNIDRRQFEAKLLVLYSPKPSDYKISDIEYTYLNKSRSLLAIPSIIKELIRYKPQLFFSSIGQLNLLAGFLSIFFKQTKFIAREASVSSYIGKKTTLMKIRKKILYNKLDVLISQSKDMKVDLQQVFSINKPLMPIIGNPITIQSTNLERKSNKSVPTFITVGRLEKVKGIDRILEVLANLDFEFKYTIIGSGSQKEALFSKIDALNLKDKVEYIPYTDDVAKYLIQSDVFLQGSHVEGFPNALLESCAMGIPVLAFNAPGGTKEIIKEGVNGFMVGNTNEFKQRLIALLSQEWNSDLIKQSIGEFESDTILKKYESLFETSVLNEAINNF